MKIKSKKKIVVSTLALAMGAALVGSVSGSVAWYQYSTRTSASMTATSAGTSRNLQVKLSDVAESQENAGDGYEGTWAQNLSATEISNYLKAKRRLTTGEGNLAPVTTGQLAKDVALPTSNNALAMKGHPVYQYNDLPAARGDEFFQLELEFRCQDTEGGVAGYAAKGIYLVDAAIDNAGGSNSKDISSAIRLHFAGNGDGQANSSAYALAAKFAEETATHANLDLNGQDGNDKDGLDGTTGNLIDYGYDSTANALNKQQSYALYDNSGATPAEIDDGTGLLAKDSDPYDFDGGVLLATTKANGDAVKVTVTVWLEGWAQLPNGSTTNPADESIWSTDYQNQSVRIDMRFACEADQ